MVQKNQFSSRFFRGHTNKISCVDVSRSGQYVASGQISHMGFKAQVIIWNFNTGESVGTYELHKVKVEAIKFSPNDHFLVSLGGEDDGSLVVYDMEKNEPICNRSAAPSICGKTRALAFANRCDQMFITAGIDTIRIWNVDRSTRHVLTPFNVALGQIKREVICMTIGTNDQYFYCGTTTGDLLKVLVNRAEENSNDDMYSPILSCSLSKKATKISGGTNGIRFSNGIASIALLRSTDQILIGSGGGMLSRVVEKTSKGRDEASIASYSPNVPSSSGKIHYFLREIRQIQLGNAAITSLSLTQDENELYVGTGSCEIYRIEVDTFEKVLLSVNHSSPVLDVTFPHACSDLFVTCSTNDIKVWDTHTSKELLRISERNSTCCAIAITRNGEFIISGWDDGKIRAFTPETGKSLFVLNNAHSKGVSSLAVTSDSKRIVSGGQGGQIRVWEIGPKSQILKESMKEHKSAVSCIKMSKDDFECVSASVDGTCIVWDLRKFTRSQIMFANNLFKCVCYDPEECQVITCGTDRTICYWEIYDGSTIRQLEGSQSGSINAMDISKNGSFIVTGGSDKLIKVWRYEEGDLKYVGIGHCSEINRLAICPNSRYIVSVSSDGAIFRWKYPAHK